MKILLACLILPLLAIASSHVSQGEALYESVTFEQFHDGRVLAVFNFTRTLDSEHISGFKNKHFRLFPKTFGETIQSFGVEELHLTFTQGRWHYDKWGHSDVAAASGVQLWTWFNTTDVDLKWKGLTNALAGSFCASLNFIDDSVTSEPHETFQPRGGYRSQIRTFSVFDQDGFQLRYGALPREITCTENLTPWTKLLPCQSKAGIAALFNPYKLYDTDFHSMSIHIQPVCTKPDCSERSLVLYQTLAAVFDPIRMSASRTMDWSLSFLFERKLQKSCPLAHESKVQVSLPATSEYTFSPDPVSVTVDENKKRSVASFSLGQDTHDLDIAVKWNHPYPSRDFEHAKSPVTVHRHLTGYGRERGGIAVSFFNHNKEKSESITYLETVPWFLKLYMHTLDISILDKATGVITKGNATALRYQPAIDRVRPSVYELSLVLPPNSQVTASLDFDRAFIKYTEHPPDANRGFDIGPGVLTMTKDSIDHPVQIFTETLLIALPTPDFSMPYNVITMTCTIMALYFGSMFNLLTRRFHPIRVEKDGEVKPKWWMFWKKR
ncbi:hypothetical protein HDU76_007039, partial [Blyttiomyces sp. JEL0837]